MNISSCYSLFSKDLLAPIYGVEMFVALVGNILALWLLVTKEKKNWNMGVVFSFNLIISDIFYALILCLRVVYYSHKEKWEFGEVLCSLERFLFTCNLYVSIYFTMCISVHRYVAIVHPIFTHTHVRFKHAKIISVFIWMFVASISSPIFYYSGLKKQKCYLFAKLNTSSMSNIRVFMAFMGCLVPFVVSFASYFGVIMAVFKNANINSEQKKKVALIVGLGCVLYAVSFGPYHILQIWHFKLKEKNELNCYVRNGYQVSKALACLNMCLHPIMYMAVFDSIRAVCCRRKSNLSNVEITKENFSKDPELITKV